MSYDPARIIRLRELRRWSQRDLAEKVGLPQPRLSAFERGTKPSKIEHLEALADALDCTIDFLVGRQFPAATTSEQIETAAAAMAYDIFAQKATKAQCSVCRRVLKHREPPRTVHAWRNLVEHIELAVPRMSGTRQLYAVGGADE